MGAIPLLLVIFLVAFIYALILSKTRLKTATYILGSVVLVIALGVVLSKIWPHGWEGTIGTLTGLASQVTGILASTLQILKSKKQSAVKTP